MESRVRQAWRAFCDAAGEAQQAGYVVRIPRDISEPLGVSATARAYAGEPQPSTEQSEPQSGQPKKRRLGFGGLTDE